MFRFNDGPGWVSGYSYTKNLVNPFGEAKLPKCAVVGKGETSFFWGKWT